MKNTESLKKILKVIGIILFLSLVIYIAIKSGDIIQGFRDGLRYR